MVLGGHDLVRYISSPKASAILPSRSKVRIEHRGFGVVGKNMGASFKEYKVTVAGRSH